MVWLDGYEEVGQKDEGVRRVKKDEGVRRVNSEW
jgi:hypothetical protein